MHDSWLCTILFGFHLENIINNSILKQSIWKSRAWSWSSLWTTPFKVATRTEPLVLPGTSRERLVFRTSQKQRDIFALFQLDHLLTSFSDLWDFGQKWFGLYDKVEEMAVEGQLWSMVMQSIYFFQTFRPLCFRSIQLCSLASSRQTLKYIVLRSPHTHFLGSSRLFFTN